MHSKDWDSILEKLIKHPDFISQIDKKGYYLSPKEISFGAYCVREWGITPTGNTAAYLSINFWHEQSKVLRNDQKYLIRTGEGTFAIFNEIEFPRPYLDLDFEKCRSNATKLSGKEPPGFDYLKAAFAENVMENTALEQLRFNGIYDQIIEQVTGKEQQYYVGIRGNTTRTFDLYFQRNNVGIQFIDTYTGQAELDYTLWIEDSVFLFEAKKGKDLDIGWHKFAYPAIRFRSFRELKIFPVYFSRNATEVLLILFPQFRFHKNGVILNDKEQMRPTRVFSVQM